MSHKLKRAIVVYKKAYLFGAQYLVTLRIPRGALCRFDPREAGRKRQKNRCSHARVMRVQRLHVGTNRPRGRPTTKEVYSRWDAFFPYRTGAVVKPTRPFDRSNDQCAPGIHFFASESAARFWWG